MRILVSKFNMIGDVVLGTALIKNLRHYYPDAHIAVATYDFCAPVLKNNPDINEIITYSKKKNFFSYCFHNFVFFTSFLFRKYETYICLRDNSRSRYLGVISRCKTRIAAASVPSLFKKWIWTYSDFPSLQGQHAIDFDLYALDAMGHLPVTKEVALYENSKQAEETKKDLPKKYIHIHPVARWAYKEIEPDKLAKVVDWIYTKGFEVVLTSSPAEHECDKVKKIVYACESSPVDLSGKVDLEQMTTICKNAELYLGPDTAVMHMAAAVNTPVLAWFGPSVTSHWGPWDNQLSENKYRDQEGVQNFGIHTILQLDLPCVPCGKKGCDDTGISKCLQDMSAEWIIEQLSHKLNINIDKNPVVLESKSKRHVQNIK